MEGTNGRRPLRELSLDFLDYLDTWQSDLTPLSLEDVLSEAGGPEHIGIFCVDVINGFCHEGPLQSKRVNGIIGPIVSLFTRAYAAGVEHFVLTQDAHDPDAAEFTDYPPHCIRGTREAQTVPELTALPCAPLYTTIPKNSVHSALGTWLGEWLDARPQVTHRIVVGDCTDLCTFHLALYLKMRANAANQRHPVYLPIDCVDTYDVPVGIARDLNIPAHPADLLHSVALYNMARNGVTVVTTLA